MNFRIQIFSNLMIYYKKVEGTILQIVEGEEENQEVMPNVDIFLLTLQILLV